jgi:hypothetical protein
VVRQIKVDKGLLALINTITIHLDTRENPTLYFLSSHDNPINANVVVPVSCFTNDLQ